MRKATKRIMELEKELRVLKSRNKDILEDFEDLSDYENETREARSKYLKVKKTVEHYDYDITTRMLVEAEKEYINKIKIERYMCSLATKEHNRADKSAAIVMLTFCTLMIAIIAMMIHFIIKF